MKIKMKKLGKLSLKQMEQEMYLIGKHEQILIIGGFDPIDLSMGNQAIGMAVLDALREYSNNPNSYGSLGDMVDYSSGNIGGTTYNLKQGTFTYNGELYQWSIANPLSQQQNITGMDDDGFTASDDGIYGNGYHSIKSGSYNQNSITIRCITQNQYDTIGEYITGSVQ